ncbi:MAG: hypothetical protein APF81_20390 [Desulfosporosinus sp. BRH_c37]|nr:MAG: hypothetical protein APF81_20390 [Desulfosporosinus sp. BRH_c37]
MNLDQIAAAGRMIELRSGQVLFHEGDEGHEMFLVLEGAIEISIEQEAKLIVIAKLSVGDFFGEMSLLDGLPRSGTAQTKGATKLVAFNQVNFRYLMQTDGELAWRIMRGLSSRIREKNQEIAQRLGKDLQYISTILDKRAQEISIAIKQIAAAAAEIGDNQALLAENIIEVKEVSRKITGFLEFIGKVATKTRMLGLNASIEASRAGEYGRGFGIVSQEIKKLSDLSSHNAVEIVKLTQTIETKMKMVGNFSEDSTKKSMLQASSTQAIVPVVNELTILAANLKQLATNL